MRSAESRAGRTLSDYFDLWSWSVNEPEAFWRLAWAELGVIGTPGERVLDGAFSMPGARWFPDARLNYAENLLRRQDATEALVFWGEDKVVRRLSYQDMYEAVGRCQALLLASGVQAGDRVAGFLPNLPEAIVAMLATASIGAVWSSASPDFGADGVLDRFGQIEPKVLFCVDGYYYNGKWINCLEKNSEVMAALPSLRKTVLVSYAGGDSGQECGGMVGWEAAVQAQPATTIEFKQVAFSHPLFIMFSSGTTGKPKCIVHSTGGTLIQHLKEHQLHGDIRRDDRLFFFTTCGWMMWNWLVSGLASECTLLLYDGNPFVSDHRVIFDFAEREKMTHLGTSAKFIESAYKFALAPANTHDLTHLRAIFSTGSPLSPESYDYVYREIKQDVHLASISGGTDIISCFALGAPTLPVYRGELQCRGLGMAVDVFDHQGRAVQGEKGELVCTRPFPSMPVGFWNDSDGERYHQAYFDRFDDVWCHGDFVELTQRGGMIIHGRSDAVLNPGGVRIGTAEIYRQIEKIDEVLESVVIGQEWQNDVRVVLFVRLRDGTTLDDALQDRIRRRIRAKATPRHVPARIVQVADIPRTRSGKIVELAVRDVVHGREIGNTESLANPEALALFRDLAALAQ